MRTAWTSLFDECHLVDLPKRRNPGQHALDGRLAQRPHAFLARRLLDFGRRLAVQDDLADVIGQIEQLAYGGAPLEARAAALDAAAALEEQTAVGQIRIDRKSVV